MAGKRCDDCGEKFNSEYYFDLHIQVGDCTQDGTSGGSKSSNTSSSQNGSSSRAQVHSGAKGTVSEYFEDKGYGFITTADFTEQHTAKEVHTKDVFFHVSNLDVAGVSEGDRLEFNIVQTDEGLEAQKPRLVERRDPNEEYADVDTDPSDRLNITGEKDDNQYGRENTTTGGDIESFDDERKFR